MQLAITTYGAYIRRKGGNFLVKTEERTAEFSPLRISSILICEGVFITSDAIKLAVEHNIDIVFLDDAGKPYGRVWHGRFGSTALIRRRQIEVCEGEEGLKFALGWVFRKFDNQIKFLKGLRERRTRKSAQITGYIRKLEELRGSLGELEGTIDEVRQRILGIEGVGGKIYFEALSGLVPEKYRFAGRSRNPAKDEFNCLLNYAYGVLYSRVERGCIIAGLDPYIGIIHTDNYNKRSLVFDLIEQYRIWADRVVFDILCAKKVDDECFDKIENGLVLNKKGKKVLIGDFSAFLDKTVRYKGRNIKRDNVILLDCHEFANRLIGEGTDGRRSFDMVNI